MSRHLHRVVGLAFGRPTPRTVLRGLADGVVLVDEGWKRRSTGFVLPRQNHAVGWIENGNDTAIGPQVDADGFADFVHGAAWDHQLRPGGSIVERRTIGRSSRGWKVLKL